MLWSWLHWALAPQCIASQYYNTYTKKKRKLSFSVSAKQTLIVTITDINDHSPIFPTPKTYTVQIPEEMAVGTPVTVIAAADADIGRNAELTYRIVTSGRDQFYMDSIFVTGSGVVRIKKVQLDYL